MYLSQQVPAGGGRRSTTQEERGGGWDIREYSRVLCAIATNPRRFPRGFFSPSVFSFFKFIEDLFREKCHGNGESPERKSPSRGSGRRGGESEIQETLFFCPGFSPFSERPFRAGSINPTGERRCWKLKKGKKKRGERARGDILGAPREGSFPGEAK